MIRVHQRLGRGSGMSMPLWLYMIYATMILLPAYTIWACVLAVKYTYLGIRYAVVEVKRRRALRHP